MSTTTTTTPTSSSSTDTPYRYVPTDLVDELSPALVAHQERIAADPLVTAYYESRK